MNQPRCAKSESYQSRWKSFQKSVESLSLRTSNARQVEFLFECLDDWNLFASLDEIAAWYVGCRERSNMHVSRIPLRDCRQWRIDEETGDVSHESGEFFEIWGLRVSQSVEREVGSKGWDQPILAQVGYDGGLLGLLSKRFEGVPHYLVEAKEEPGNYNIVQISPSLQATFSNLKRAHEGRRPRFAELFEEPQRFGAKVLYDAWLSEDGGRLHNKRNRGILVEVDADFETGIEDLPTFRWVSMYQMKALLRENAWVNPHIRGIIANLGVDS